LEIRMKRLSALAILVAPLGVLAVSTPVAAQQSSPLSQVSTHLKAVDTMVARFSQTDRRGQTLDGTLTLKRPGKIRFQYGRGIPMLIVGDGKALTFVDYEVKQVSRWPIGDSPLSVLLNPEQDLSRVARVTRNDDRVLLIEARDPKKPQFGTIAIAFAKVPSAPAGLLLQGWTTLDSQNNRTTVKLSDQRFNVAVADSNFRFTDPRRRPKA
jgi:chaperone LolA